MDPITLMLIGGGLLMLSGAGGDAIRRLSFTDKVKRQLRLDNLATGRDAERLVWTAQNELPILGILGEAGYSHIKLVGGFRGDALQAYVLAQAGRSGNHASKTSLHCHGLALDFGFFKDKGNGPTNAARYLRTQAHRIPIQPRDVVAEYTALHIDWRDGLYGQYGGAPRATRWLQQHTDGSFSPLT